MEVPTPKLEKKGCAEGRGADPHDQGREKGREHVGEDVSIREKPAQFVAGVELYSKNGGQPRTEEGPQMTDAVDLPGVAGLEKIRPPGRSDRSAGFGGSRAGVCCLSCLHQGFHPQSDIFFFEFGGSALKAEKLMNQQFVQCSAFEFLNRTADQGRRGFQMKWIARFRGWGEREGGFGLGSPKVLFHRLDNLIEVEVIGKSGGV